MVENQNNQKLDTWSLYLYAMKSPVTREKYQKRLEKFFDFIGLEGQTIEEKSRVFVNSAKKEGNGWIFQSCIKIYAVSIRPLQQERNKIEPPIMAAIPIITMSKRFSERTTLCSWGCVVLQAD